MAKVILSLNGNLQGEFVLHKDRMMIGRKSENDIPINNLAVSGQHAVLVSRFGDTIIEDLGSTNGTYINGTLIKKQLLQSDDVISVGKHELTFIDDTAKKSEEESRKRDVLTDSSNRTASEGLDKNTSPNTDQNTDQNTSQASKTNDHIGPRTANILQGKLHVLNGPIAGKELPLNRALVTLGKLGVQVAVISKRPQGYFLTHIEGNKEGQQVYPKVNGDSIGAKAFTLENNDIIELAGIKMEFTIES